jgi:hypothetical protein
MERLFPALAEPKTWEEKIQAIAIENYMKCCEEELYKKSVLFEALNDRP